MAIEVELLNEDNIILARSVRIRHARGSLETPVYAVSAAQIYRRVIGQGDLQGVVELSMMFRPEQLDSMARDASLQQKFEHRVNSYVKKIPSDQLVVTVPLLESRRGFPLSDNNDRALTYGDYIAELVSNPRVDITCTPVFHGVAERIIELLVEEFLHAMTSYNIDVALSIPYASRECWGRIVKIYFKWLSNNNRMLLNFLCVDYNSSNPIAKYALHNYALRYTRTLQEEISEPVAIYGVNVKYGRVAGKYEELPARDLASYFAQLDIMGENHKRRALPKEVIEKTRSESSFDKQKLLNRKRYTYISLGKMLENPGLAIPEIKYFQGIEEERHRIKDIERIARQVNLRSILTEAKILKQIFSGKGWQGYGKPEEYLKSKKIIHIDSTLLKKIKNFAKPYKYKAKKLDKYL